VIQAVNGCRIARSGLDQWAYEHAVRLQFIEPGKPIQMRTLSDGMDPARHPNGVAQRARMVASTICNRMTGGSKSGNYNDRHQPGKRCF
jgi:hypothetical protein